MSFPYPLIAALALRKADQRCQKIAGDNRIFPPGIGGVERLEISANPNAQCRSGAIRSRSMNGRYAQRAAQKYPAREPSSLDRPHPMARVFWNAFCLKTPRK